MKITTRDHILKRFRENWKKGKDGFANAQLIEDVLHPITGRKHETIGRELRRMAEEGLLEAQEMKLDNAKVASIYYKYIPTRNEILSANFKRMNETTHTTM